MTSRVRAIGAVTVLVVVLGLLLIGFGNGCTPGSPQGNGSSSTPSTASGTSRTDSESGLPWIAESALPAEARETLRLIDKGGPYPYDRDGAVFGNFEGLLPQQSRGYYHEYTVRTPGSKDRGARRIVAGKGGEFYWTADHYQSFQRIRR